MYQYRQVLLRMRQGDSDRDIARSKLMGRKKAKAVRAVADRDGGRTAATAVPDDAARAAAFTPAGRAPRCVSTLEPLRTVIEAWCAQGVQGTTIHGALERNHGYTGSYSAVRRFL